MTELTDNDKQRDIKIIGYPKRTRGTLSIKERFDKYIFYSPDGCWYWIGYVCKDGYGRMNIIQNERNFPVKAHRLAYQIYKGEIPDGMYVLHSCDNPRCVNPDHLSIGTQKDNIQDMFRKGRSRNQNRKKLALNNKP